MSDAVHAYRELPAHERRLFATLLALHRPASRTELTRLFDSLGLRDADGRALTTMATLPLFQRWQALGLTVTNEREQWLCDVRVQHAVAAEAMADGVLREAAKDVRALEPLAPYGQRPRVVRELFLSLYDEPDKLLPSYLRADLSRAEDRARALLEAYGWHVSREALERMGPERAHEYAVILLTNAVTQLTPLSEGPLAYAVQPGAPAPVRALAAQYLALRGEQTQAEALVSGDETECHAGAAFVALTRGDLAQARASALHALARTRGKGGQRFKGLTHALWPWVTLLLLTDQSDARAATLGREQLALAEKKLKSQVQLLDALTALGRHMDAPNRPGGVFMLYTSHASSWAEALLYAWVYRITRLEPASKALAALRSEYAADAASAGFVWVARALEEHTTLDFVNEEAPWQRALRALEHAAERNTGAAESSSSSKAERIVWVLTLQRGRPLLTPRLQTKKASSYSAGRAVSLKRLAQSQAAPDDALDAYDHKVLRHLIELRQPWGPPELALAPEAALELVGHPRVYADLECRAPLTVERGQAALHVEATAGGGFRVQVLPSGCASFEVYGEQDGPDRIRLYELSAAQREVVTALPLNGLELPPEARAAVERALGKLSALFPMQAAVELGSTHFVDVPADPRIHVQLRRTPGGLRVAFAVVPLPGQVRFVPGEGSPSVLARQGDDTLRAQRDLPRELRALAQLRRALDVPGDEPAFTVMGLPGALELVCALKELGDAVVVEWPEGDPLSIAAAPDLGQLRVRVEEAKGWLEAEGELPVDDVLTLSFHDLVARAHTRQGRFMALDDGRFVALSAALSRAIDTMEAMARVEEGAVTLHPLALLALGQLEQVELDGELADRLARAREAPGLLPQVPATFAATLRPYQVEGFRFLCRLAHWGAGACLADDMGLGKTLQTLALLVARAPDGPQLVVAPTSVCGNWLEEARKFAPTLRVRLLGSGGRARALDELAPFDLVVCSYGVLQQERERLGAIEFQTVVLDEAQAIKNASTQRAKAAFALRARQRVALTGTPVENHLGELWSLFQFLNPGALGSQREFEQRFARAIEREGDKERAQQLRRIAAPFVLRRKKSEVLDDLPEKTVITLRIEPSDAERALYRALREQALARIHQSAQPAQARMQLFAELTRMRRAACHPALVVPEGAVPSSKLAALETLVAELREGGHRALLFSQFVDHLALVRARLDALGISYQYLDGSSSQTARAAATQAFQRGEGELFLISLKAGGFGLNLTAADYVIHLDPWWNPAVEDQASDRAHRIGQTRPVTVYRLVMQGSIEEKILALHGQKRELADSVLTGDSQAAPDIDELLSLLADVHAPHTPSAVAVEA